LLAGVFSFHLLAAGYLAVLGIARGPVGVLLWPMNAPCRHDDPDRAFRAFERTLRRPPGPTVGMITSAKGDVMKQASAAGLRASGLAALMLAFTGPPAMAQEPDPMAILKGMSDYLASTAAFAFEYDTTLDVVTTDDQKIGLTASGTAVVARPDRIRATRSAGFAEVEMVFDGETLSVIERNEGVYARIPAEGSIDALIEALLEEHGALLPASDLLMSDPFAALMEGDVTEARDLGSGVIGGRECDHLAFRSAEVDWQIWIAQGDAPSPCRLTITARDVSQAPQYTIDIRDWRAGDAAAGDFDFEAPAGATEVELSILRAAVLDLPPHFTTGDVQ
jgi:hypothetical protein